MRKVSLADSIESSVLGFSCAPILGVVGGKDADRALNLALDGGVSHFDVARSYGYGEAEAFLGKFFSGRRDEVVIASKFGIKANWKADLMRPLKPLIRALRERKQGQPVEGASNVTAPAMPKKDHFHDRIPINPESMVASLHRSLKALRTDYLDVFFVHEPTAKLENVAPLMEQAESLKKQGKIRTWGLAMDWNDHEFHTSYVDQFDVLQFNNSPEADHYSQVWNARQHHQNIFFSPFEHQRKLSEPETLKKLWVDFPSSVILCSMFAPEEIHSYIKAANEETSSSTH